MEDTTRCINDTCPSAPFCARRQPIHAVASAVCFTSSKEGWCGHHQGAVVYDTRVGETAFKREPLPVSLVLRRVRQLGLKKTAQLWDLHPAEIKKFIKTEKK